MTILESKLKVNPKNVKDLIRALVYVVLWTP